MNYGHGEGYIYLDPINNKYLRKLSLGLDHVIQNQLRENTQRVRPDNQTGVSKPAVHLQRPRFQNIGETDGQVSSNDDAVGSYCFIFASFEDSEEQLKLAFTKGFADEHEPPEGHYCCGLESALGES